MGCASDMVEVKQEQRDRRYSGHNVLSNNLL